MVKNMQVIFEEISNALIVSSIVIQCLIFIMLLNKRFALAFKYKVFLTKKRKIWWLQTITSPVTFMFVIGLTIWYLNGGLNPLVAFIVSMILFYSLNIFISYNYLDKIVRRYFNCRDFNEFLDVMVETSKKRKI